MSDAAGRLLVLVRHAKAERPSPGQADADRALAPQGVADAREGGRRLARLAAPDLVLCSTARRTRETCTALLEGMREVTPGLAPDVRHLPALYGGGPFDVLRSVRPVPATAGIVVVVAHEPAMSATTLALAGPDSDPDAVREVMAGFPTSGMAVLAVGPGPAQPGSWATLSPGDGRLTGFVVPRP